MSPYLPIVIMLLMAALIGIISMVIGVLIRPSKPDKSKLSVYECGVPEFGDARKRYNVRFYVIAMLFVIFDVEIVFLFPWAVAFDKVGLLGLTSVFVFLIILIVGYFYDWKKGVLEWE